MKPVQVAIAIGIAILLPLLAQMTVRIYAEPPKYEYPDYYAQQQLKPAERAKAKAEAKEKEDLYEKQQAAFNLQVFYLAFPLGILEIVAGFLFRRRSTLAAGILFGGLSTVACGSFSSWETLPGWSRYVSLLFVLILLGYLAIAIDRTQKTESSSQD